MELASEMPAENAMFGPALMIVANTVSVMPTRRERLDGNTEATRAVGGGSGTVKHSPVASVWLDAAKTLSPEYDTRQQYWPIALVLVVASEVACPFASRVFTAPICVPPETHPPAV